MEEVSEACIILYEAELQTKEGLVSEHWSPYFASVLRDAYYYAMMFMQLINEEYAHII